MERKMAYKCKKYHSGWIWTGELDRSETKKFTGSADQSGNASNQISIPQKNLRFAKSLNENACPNFIFKRGLAPPEAELPVECKRNKCRTTINITEKGKIKCSA
jgi:hypothetical protein